MPFQGGRCHLTHACDNERLYNVEWSGGEAERERSVSSQKGGGGWRVEEKEGLVGHNEGKQGQ